MSESKLKVKPGNRKIRSPKDPDRITEPIPGRTALVLSGGGSRGAYQVGVWRALRELDIPIHIAVGTSIGAMNAAAVAQDAYKDAEALWNQLETDMVFDYAHVVENRGVKFTTIKDILRQNLDEEKIRDSEVAFGIVTVKFPSMEPLYLWKEDIPKDEMLDYILASSSCFPAVTPYEIHDEKFLDGAFYDYMPISMALEKGADRIIAVNLQAAGKVREEDLAEAKDRTTLIQCHWDLGSFLIFDTDNARHIMRLGYLDTLKSFGILEGYRYAFGKDQMDLRTLRNGEYAAFAFGLDPEIIYTKDVFLRRLREAVAEYMHSEDSDLDELRKGFKKLSFLQIEKSMEKVRRFSRRAVITYIADFLQQQEHPSTQDGQKTKEPPAPIRKALEKIFERDVAAAEWLIHNNLIAR
ncbi:MAG: patatin-like phospholipase family protein [Eubacteriales bacterium]|nr:patatin-like phospholipase family protein [Eubacteriales bacterium]